jgi:hypothetical protein
MFFQSLDIWSGLTFRYSAYIGQEAEGSHTVCTALFAVTGDLRQRARTTLHGLRPYFPGYQLVCICQQNDHSSVADIPPSSTDTTGLPRMTTCQLFQIYYST